MRDLSLSRGEERSAIIAVQATLELVERSLRSGLHLFAQCKLGDYYCSWDKIPWQGAGMR